MPLRVVFDTSVLISAFIFSDSVSRNAFELGVKGRIIMVTSPAIMAEFANKLGDKFCVPKRDIEIYLRQIVLFSEVYRPNFQFNILSDRPDNRILECAVKGNADLIVTGDKQILALKNFKGIGVCRSADLIHTVIAQSL